MTGDFKIKFNNHYANSDSSKQYEFEVKISQGWKITNYNPNEKSPSGAGDMTLSVFDNSYEYKRGQTVFNEDVKMNQTKFDIFKEIVNMHDDDGAKGNDNILSDEDLKKARNDIDKNDSILKNLGVTTVRLDENNGIATIVIGNNEILRFQYKNVTKQATAQKAQSTEYKVASGDTLSELAEKYGVTVASIRAANRNLKDKDLKAGMTIKIPSSSQATAQKAPSQTAASSVSKTNNTEKSNKTTQAATVNKSSGNYNQNPECLLNELFDAYLPKGYDNFIDDVAKRADVSVDFVKLLFLTEGDYKKGFEPVKEAYYDSKGVLTIGLGHTNSPRTFQFDKNTKITLEQAKEILIKDIKYQKEQLIKEIGQEKYDSLKENRTSLAYALVDWSFNAGTDRFKKSKNVKANLAEDNYFGLATTSLFNEDDARRSFYRLAFAISYMQPKDRARAMTEFLDRTMKTKNCSYKDFILSELKGKELELVKKIIKTYSN